MTIWCTGCIGEGKTMLNTRFGLGVVGAGCAAVLLVASCGPKPAPNGAQQPANGPQPPAATATPPDAPAPYELTLVTDPPAPPPGKPTKLLVSLTHKATGVAPKLKLAHEKLLHLIVVRKDLGSFLHLHPELQSDGKLAVEATFPTAGEYLVFADFTPEDAGQQVARQTLTVSGTAPAAVALTPDTDQPRVDGDVKATLTSQPDPLVPNSEGMLTFRLTGAKSDKPVSNLKPYLGAMGHAVILSADGQDFLHAHPMENGGQTGGMKGMGHTGGEHGDQGGHGAPTSGSTSATPATVAFHTEFPRAGLYKVWGQFNVGGRVRTMSFVVPVGTVR